MTNLKRYLIKGEPPSKLKHLSMSDSEFKYLEGMVKQTPLPE